MQAIGSGPEECGSSCRNLKENAPFQDRASPCDQEFPWSPPHRGLNSRGNVGSGSGEWRSFRPLAVQKILCPMEHGLEKAISQLRITKVKEPGMVACLPQFLQNGWFGRNKICIIKDRNLMVHQPSLLSRGRSSHVETNHYLNLPEKNHPGRADPGERHNAGGPDNSLLSRAKSFLDDLPLIAHEERASSHGVNSFFHRET